MPSRRPARSGRSSSPAAPPELPPYEEPSCPLDATAKKALADIANNRLSTRKYETHLKQSAEHLKESVSTLNDRLYERKRELQRLVQRRQEKHLAEKTEQEEAEEHAAEMLENEVPGLTDEIEVAFREILDRQAELQDERDAITAVAGQLYAEPQPSSYRESLNAASGDGEDSQERLHTGAIELLKRARKTKAAEYDKLSMHQKYAMHNEYVNFRRTLHDALHPDDDVALPDASAWFDREGQPTIRRSHSKTADASDDDLVIDREVISFACPLTLRTMEEPFSNNKCKHTFEKSAIFEYLARGPQRCPQTGCSQVRGFAHPLRPYLSLAKLLRTGANTAN